MPLLSHQVQNSSTIYIYIQNIHININLTFCLPETLVALMHFRTGLGLGSGLGFRSGLGWGLGLGFRCESALAPAIPWQDNKVWHSGVRQGKITKGLLWASLGVKGLTCWLYIVGLGTYKFKISVVLTYLVRTPTCKIYIPIMKK